MSGICGWSHCQFSGDVSEAVLNRMVAELQLNAAHVPIATSQAFFSTAAVGLAHERDTLSSDGIQVVYQGRMRWKSASLDRLAKSRGMASALIEAYRAEGPRCLSGLMGAFALAVVDLNEQSTLLAIDRSGIHSLFYTQSLNHLIFSSNARAILKHPDVSVSINAQALFEYVYFHMVPSPSCIFSKLQKILPGQYVLFKDQKLSQDFYWQPEYEENSLFNKEELAGQLRKKMKSAVDRSLPGSNIGTFLSGGTDSSTITGLARQRLGKPIDSYSIGFEADGYDELAYARLASKHFDVRAHEYYLKPQDIVDVIPLIAKTYDEPFGNASIVPAYYCAKLAKEDGMETLLAGDGGDELFAGNARYAKQKVFEAYSFLPEFVKQRFIEPAVLNFSDANKIPWVSKLQSYIRQAKTPLPERLEAYNFLNRFLLGEIFEPDFLIDIDIESPLKNLKETYDRAKADSSLNRMLFLDLKIALADNDLRKVNRMCELAQIEVRYPMLDDELLAFSTKLPSSLKLRGFQLRHLFKHAFKGFLPPEIIKKSKHGFGMPFGLWMNEHPALKEIALDSLSHLSLRGIVKEDFIEHLKMSHAQHPSYYGVMLWVLMMLEQWLQSQD